MTKAFETPEVTSYEKEELVIETAFTGDDNGSMKHEPGD